MATVNNSAKMLMQVWLFPMCQW